MRKKIMIAASVAMIACGAFVGVKKSVANKSGDLLLANVEALADEGCQVKAEEDVEVKTTYYIYDCYQKGILDYKTKVVEVERYCPGQGEVCCTPGLISVDATPDGTSKCQHT